MPAILTYNITVPIKLIIDGFCLILKLSYYQMIKEYKNLDLDNYCLQHQLSKKVRIYLRLKERVYAPQWKESDKHNDSCCICLNKYKGGDMIIDLDCNENHIFHK